MGLLRQDTRRDDAAEIGADASRIRRNAFLEEIYIDFYQRLARELPRDRYPRLLELGSGGGFFRDFVPDVITSDIVAGPGIDRVVDACKLGDAFPEGSIDAITAINVFHHLPDVRGFLRGASRVLRPGGRIALIEPWYTPVGQFFHRWIHHEPSVADPDRWEVVGEGRLSGSNTRLPTSVFRDSETRFSREFPALRIVKREPFHKWLYLFSGGLKLNTRVPRSVARWLVRRDGSIRVGDATLGIFALVVVERRAE